MKQNKTIKVFLTLALTLTMCMSSLTTVFAAGGSIYGTEENPAQAAITKMLQMPEGTITPAADFTFAFAKKSVDGNTADADLATMPEITDKTISYTSADVGTTTAGLKSVPKETDNIFDTLTWPHAGVYTYTITETADTYTASTGETMTYSGGEYDITVYVENGTNGNLYIGAIGTTIEIKDNSGQTEGDKVDPTPGADGEYSKLIFTNTYTKNNGGTDPVDDSVLSISKMVAGDMADQSKYFVYDLTVTQAATLPDTTTYKVYVVEGNTVLTTIPTANYSGTVSNDGTYDYIQVTAGTPVTVNLKHNQRLSFTDAAVGTSYVAVEAAAADYTPSVSIVVNGGTPNTVNGTINTSLSTNTQLIGEAANSADFTNTYKEVTPTGISLNNLPFLMMIVLAAGALTAFVVVKFRKKDYSK